MRKSYIALLLGLLLSISIQAQTQFKVSPKIGLNSSAINLSEDGLSDRNIGFQVGVDFRIGSSFYFAPGIHWVSQTTDFENINSSLEARGLRIPVFIGGDLITADRWGLRLYAGPSALLIFNDDKLLDQLNDWGRENVNWGLDVGIGADIGIFTVDLQHSWGVNDLIQWGNQTGRTRTLYFSIGLFF